VDNASEDGSVQYLKTLFSDVKVISLPENIGFAGANNEGFKFTHGDYILLFNNDAEADKECIGNLFTGMEANPDVGICASKVIECGGNIIDSASDGFSANLKGFKRGEGQLSNLYSKEEYVFGACAGAALYRRKMIEKIGFLDEDFFLIYEDTDLNLRAQLTGWKVRYVPSAVVQHRVRSSIGHMSDMAVYYSLRNSELIRFKNIPFGIFIRCLPYYVLSVFLEFLYFAVKHGKLRLYFKAKTDAVKLLPRMLKKRRDIMNTMKIDNKYLLSIITSIWDKEYFLMKVKKFLYG